MAGFLLGNISRTNASYVKCYSKLLIRNKSTLSNRLYDRGRVCCSLRCRFFVPQVRSYVIAFNHLSAGLVRIRKFTDGTFIRARLFHSSSVSRDHHTLSVPPFAESVTEGDVRWEKGVGDSVVVDEVVCEIETDKTSIPVPSPVSGTLEEQLVADGATVKAGQQIGRIKIVEGGVSSSSSSSSSSPPSPAATKQHQQRDQEEHRHHHQQQQQQQQQPSVPQPETSTSSSSAVGATPPPAAVSAKMNVKPDLPVAAIKHAASLESATVKVPPPDPTTEIAGTRTEQRVKMNRMRLRIAQRLKDAQNTTAMLTTFNEVDMSNIMAFRKANLDAFQKKYGIKLGFMSAFLKASAHALQEQPVVNAVIDGNEIVYRDYVDISVAVATPKGLVVPVVRNVESMSYADIEKAIAALGEKARINALAVEDMDGGTFTVSNGGVFGSLMGTPIINPPQSAILGMHSIVERPVAANGQVVIRPMMYVALTYDHRLIDGREAVLFLRKIKAGVENPAIIVAGL